MKRYKYTTTVTYNGKRYYIRADTKSELETKKIRKLVDLQVNGEPIRNNITVEQWAMTCIDTYKTSQKPVTRKKYISRVRHCILDEIGSMRLSDVLAIHCQEVLNKQAGKSKTQINEVYNALRFIFSKAKENKLIRENPAEFLTKPSGSASQRRALTEEERALVHKVAKKKRKYYIYLLMLDCGCRPSEAAEARGADIIQGDVNLLHIRGTKTKNADRLVPIPGSLFKLIKDTPEDEYIAHYDGGGQITFGNRSRVWQAFKRDLNIEMGAQMYRNSLLEDLVSPDLVPYCLRHDYCSHMLAGNGIDIRTAQALMGHSDISLTANIYTHVDRNAVIDAAKKIK